MQCCVDLFSIHVLFLYDEFIFFFRVGTMEMNGSAARPVTRNTYYNIRSEGNTLNWTPLTTRFFPSFLFKQQQRTQGLGYNKQRATHIIPFPPMNIFTNTLVRRSRLDWTRRVVYAAVAAMTCFVRLQSAGVPQAAAAARHVTVERNNNKMKKKGGGCRWLRLTRWRDLWVEVGCCSVSASAGGRKRGV